MKKVYFSDSGTLIDLTTKVEDYFSTPVNIDYTTIEDYIYIGSELPFNSLFFDVVTANEITVTAAVEYWDGRDWVSMVDLQDETSVNDISMSKNGHMTWLIDKSNGWVSEDTVGSNGSENITGLGNIVAYDLYWLRLSFDSTLTSAMTMNWIGPKFCNTADVDGEYRLLAKSVFKTSYETGKTDWEREIILASRIIVDDLQAKGTIISSDQLMERRVFKDACVTKVAELVFTNMGDDYIDDATRAKAEYKTRLNKKNYKVDIDGDGKLDKKELGVTVGHLSR